MFLTAEINGQISGVRQSAEQPEGPGSQVQGSKIWPFSFSGVLPPPDHDSDESPLARMEVLTSRLASRQSFQSLTMDKDRLLFYRIQNNFLRAKISLKRTIKPTRCGLWEIRIIRLTKISVSTFARMDGVPHPEGCVMGFRTVISSWLLQRPRPRSPSRRTRGRTWPWCRGRTGRTRLRLLRWTFPS